jgi:hypothetical protein
MQNAESPHSPFAKGGLGGIKLYRKTSEEFFENDISSEDSQ